MILLSPLFTLTLWAVAVIPQNPAAAYFEESHEETDDARDYIPCGSLVYVEVDEKYYIRNEIYGGNNHNYESHRHRRSEPVSLSEDESTVNKRIRRGKGDRLTHCAWRFESNGKCRLMVHFDHYYPGDRSCGNQYIFVTDDDMEMQACSTRGLPRAFEATTNRIKIKHYRKRNIHLSEFEGYVICHSHGKEYADEHAEEYSDGHHSRHHSHHSAYEYPEGTYDDTQDGPEVYSSSSSYQEGQRYTASGQYPETGRYRHPTIGRYPETTSYKNLASGGYLETESYKNEGETYGYGGRSFDHQPSIYPASSYPIYPPISISEAFRQGYGDYPRKFSQPLPHALSRRLQQQQLPLPKVHHPSDSSYSDSTSAPMEEYHGRNFETEENDAILATDSLSESVSNSDTLT